MLPLRGFGLGFDYIQPDTSKSDKVRALIERAPTCITDDQYQMLAQACAMVPQIKGLGITLLPVPAGLITDPLLQLAVLDPCGALSQIPRCPSGGTDPPPTDPSTDPPPVDEMDEDEPNYALWGGIILVVVAAGGYAVYRSIK